MGRPQDAFHLMRKFGVGITNSDLKKIKVANVNLLGDDDDHDGLSNMIEDSFDTNKYDADTDGDGHSDKEEILTIRATMFSSMFVYRFGVADFGSKMSQGSDSTNISCTITMLGTIPLDHPLAPYSPTSS